VPWDRDVRVRDPAARDQEGAVWRRGRFAERVRREWNAVPGREVDACLLPDADAGATAGYDLTRLAQAVQRRVGGDAEPIRARLEEFADAEMEGDTAAPDPLVRPGAGSQP